ncbi:MAG: hypothetical protein FWG35_07270, partial [Spirochaetaceae bacterium]|nr:hypothetical protein [Spirochaetaceae bacterium]
MLAGVSCLLWLAAYSLYFKEQPGGAAPDFRDLGQPVSTTLPEAPATPESDPAAGGSGSVAAPEAPTVISAGGAREKPPAATGHARPVPQAPGAGQARPVET